MIKRCFVVVALMLIASSLKAQETSIVGTWLMDVDKSVSMMTKTTRSRYDSLPAEKQAKVKSTMSGRVFSFQSEGNINVTWKSGTQQRESSGKWTYGTESGTIQITIDNKPQVFDYSFSEGGLQLKIREGAGFFPTLCFIRQ